MPLSVATWNVNGIRAREEQFLDWVERDRPDILCLQEIKASPEKLSERLCDLGDYWCAWHGEGGYSGVALHLRRERFPEQPDFHHPPFDHECRIVAADLGDLVIASIYVPNGGKDFDAKLRFLQALRAWAVELASQDRAVLLCGDLNVARSDVDVHPSLMKKKPMIGTLPEERELLEGILEAGFADVGRELEPDNERLFTWWAPWRNLRQRNIGWRIDYVLASAGLFETVRECRVLSDVGTSDHAPVVAVFEGEPGAATRG